MNQSIENKSENKSDDLKDESKMSDPELKAQMVDDLKKLSKREIIDNHISLISQTSLLYQLLTKEKQRQIQHVKEIVKFVPIEIQNENKEKFIYYKKLYQCSGCDKDFKINEQYHITVNGAIYCTPCKDKESRKGKEKKEKKH